MKTMPGSAATRTTRPSRKKDQSNLAVNVREFIGGDNPVGAELIHIEVGSSGRQFVNLLRPVDTQSRVDGCHHVLDARLDLVFPARVDAGPAIAIGSAQHQS